MTARDLSLTDLRGLCPGAAEVFAATRPAVFDAEAGIRAAHQVDHLAVLACPVACLSGVPAGAPPHACLVIPHATLAHQLAAHPAHASVVSPRPVGAVRVVVLGADGSWTVLDLSAHDVPAIRTNAPGGVA